MIDLDGGLVILTILAIGCAAFGCWPLAVLLGFAVAAILMDRAG